MNTTKKITLASVLVICTGTSAIIINNRINKNKLNAKIEQIFIEAKESERKKDFQSAQAKYELAIGIAPKHGKAWHEYAKFCLSNGKHEQAINAFTKAIELGHNMASTYAGRANSKIANPQTAGNRAEILSDFASAIKLNNDYLEDRALFYLNNSELENAQIDFENYIKTAKTISWSTYYNLGLTKELKNKNDAKADFIKSKNLAPSELLPICALARLEDDVTKKLEFLKEGLSIDPNNHIIYSTILEELNKGSINSSPGSDFSKWVTTGNVRQILGGLGTSGATLSNGSAMFHRGLLRAFMSDRMGAKSDFQSAIKHGYSEANCLYSIAELDRANTKEYINSMKTAKNVAKETDSLLGYKTQYLCTMSIFYTTMSGYDLVSMTLVWGEHGNEMKSKYGDASVFRLLQSIKQFYIEQTPSAFGEWIKCTTECSTVEDAFSRLFAAKSWEWIGILKLKHAGGFSSIPYFNNATQAYSSASRLWSAHGNFFILKQIEASAYSNDILLKEVRQLD